MTIVYRSVKGSNLTPAEVDGNFTDLDGRVTTLETTPPSPNNIASITLVGSQLTITMDDASTFGPFTVPIALLHWRDEWTALEDYTELDLVLVDFDGVYLVLQDHTAAATFDAGRLIGGDPVYRKIIGLIPFTLDVPWFWKGTLPDGELIYRYVANEAVVFPAFGDLSTAHFTPPTAGQNIDIQLNGVSQGALAVATDGTYFFSNDTVTMAAGDYLDFVSPSPPDGTLADLGVNLHFVRGEST